MEAGDEWPENLLSQPGHDPMILESQRANETPQQKLVREEEEPLAKALEASKVDMGGSPIIDNERGMSMGDRKVSRNPELSLAFAEAPHNSLPKIDRMLSQIWGSQQRLTMNGRASLTPPCH